MPDAPAAAPTPAAPAAPAAPAPKAQSLAAIKAARRGESIAANQVTQVVPSEADMAGGKAVNVVSKSEPDPEPAKTEEKPTEDPKTASIDMDAGSLARFTQLSKNLREAQTKLKNANERIAAFGKFEKAQTLAKEGKHYDAAREAGIDVDAALAELLGNNNGQPVTAGQIDQKLRQEIDDLKAFRDDTLKEREERKKADAEASTKNDRAIAGKFVADNATNYPHLAKSEKLLDMAFADFTKARAQLEAESGEKLSTAEQSKLMVDALAVHEEDWSKTFGAAKTEPAETRQAGVDDGVRAGVRQPVEQVKKKLTFEELKAERLAKRMAARRG